MTTHNEALPSGSLITPSVDPRSAILAALEEEHRLYCRLLILAQAKRGALLAGDVDRLAPLVREIEGIAATLTDLEADRRAGVAQLAGGELLDDSFATLAPQFTGDDRARLDGLRDRLREVVERLRIVNDLNAALVRQALSFTEQWARLVRAALPATYTLNGAVVGLPAGGRAWCA